jgi:hypothetical protein
MAQASAQWRRKIRQQPRSCDTADVPLYCTSYGNPPVHHAYQYADPNSTAQLNLHSSLIVFHQDPNVWRRPFTGHFATLHCSLDVMGIDGIEEEERSG